MVDKVRDLRKKIKINILRIILFSSGSNLTNIIRLAEVFKVMVWSEKFPDTAEGLNSPIGRLRGKKILPSCKRSDRRPSLSSSTTTTKRKHVPG